ncbi:MAG TPA: tRNA (guanosine(37)-N1)-methyltransferase TrmD [Acidimicrobiales bacterium]|nr:tRNA (guanosine(37)-N1)-methyltransferase TrmD [Acidimicrobiales bacterium]
MRVDVFTLFPDVVDAYLDASLIGKARAEGVLDLRVHDLRAQASGVHRSVDDAPYGGGAGMVLMPEPVFAAIEAVAPPRPLFALTPSGRVFDQALARSLAAGDGFSLLCGRYEGFDARITDHLVDGELSIGDFVLAGGEPAAFVVIEAVARLVPGVLGNATSPDEESFGDDGLLEYPQYPRPPSFRGWDVPDVLRSGDHGAIAGWRKAKALVRTLRRRPDLIARRGGLTDAERSLLDRWAPGEYD